MKRCLSMFPALLLLAGCAPKDSAASNDTPSGGVQEESKIVEEAAAPVSTSVPSFTPELTQVPTPTPEPLHLTREDVEKYKDCVWFTAKFCAPEYLIVTHPDGTISAGLLYDLFAAENWTGITAIAAGDSHLVGLKNDGTLRIAGNFDPNSSDLLMLTDIGPVE